MPMISKYDLCLFVINQSNMIFAFVVKEKRYIFIYKYANYTLWYFDFFYALTISSIPPCSNMYYSESYTVLYLPYIVSIVLVLYCI